MRTTLALLLSQIDAGGECIIAAAALEASLPCGCTCGLSNEPARVKERSQVSQAKGISAAWVHICLFKSGPVVKD